MLSHSIWSPRGQDQLLLVGATLQALEHVHDRTRNWNWAFQGEQSGSFCWKGQVDEHFGATPLAAANLWTKPPDHQIGLMLSVCCLGPYLCTIPMTPVILLHGTAGVSKYEPCVVPFNPCLGLYLGNHILLLYFLQFPSCTALGFSTMTHAVSLTKFLLRTMRTMMSLWGFHRLTLIVKRTPTGSKESGRVNHFSNIQKLVQCSFPTSTTIQLQYFRNGLFENIPLPQLRRHVLNPRP